MRFKDGPTTHASATTDLTPEQLWPFVSDMTLPTQFSEELQKVEWLDGIDGPTLGGRFRGFNQRGERTWQTDCTIIEYQPNRSIAWAVIDVDSPSSTWRFEIEAGEVTTLTESVTVGPGWSGLLAAIEKYPDKEEQLIAGRLASLQENMQRTVDGLIEMASAAA